MPQCLSLRSVRLTRPCQIYKRLEANIQIGPWMYVQSADEGRKLAVLSIANGLTMASAMNARKLGWSVVPILDIGLVWIAYHLPRVLQRAPSPLFKLVKK